MASYLITGKAYWAKVLGDPVDNYSKDGKEWTIDVALDREALGILKGLGLDHKVRSKDDGRGPFVTFTRRELKRRTGAPNTPIRVVDFDNKVWDKSKPIGNGSTVQVKFNTFEPQARGAKKGYAILEVKVLDWVEYNPTAIPVPTEKEAF